MSHEKEIIELCERKIERERRANRFVCKQFDKKRRETIRKLWNEEN